MDVARDADNASSVRGGSVSESADDDGGDVQPHVTTPESSLPSQGPHTSPEPVGPKHKPLGPDSLTWKYFGDLRTALLGTFVTAMQNMLPALGTAVEERSTVFDEPLQRVARSMYPIMGVVYDGERASATGRQIVGYHRTITNVSDDKIPHTGWRGRRYHALDPETFYWAHSTFFVQMLRTAETFCGGLTEDQKRQLFDEHVRWYAQYGLSMRPVPKTWEQFCQYWCDKCRDELEINPATTAILDIRIPKPGFIPLPTRAWRRVTAPFVAGTKWLSVGMLDPVVQNRAGLRWTWTDEAMLRLYGKAVELAYAQLPERLRLHVRARAGYQRARGHLPADAPLPQAPGLFGPAKDAPEHYVPTGAVADLVSASLPWAPVLTVLLGAAYCRGLAAAIDQVMGARR